MSSSNWWANKMGTPQATPVPPMAPPQPTPVYPTPQQQPPLQNSYPTTVASPAQSCPNCRSGNYGSMDPNIKARCYDCGYPIVQSASSTPGIGQQPISQAPMQKAKQISTANNFNPQGIIGHI